MIKLNLHKGEFFQKYIWDFFNESENKFVYRSFKEEVHRENFLNGEIWFPGLTQNRLFLSDGYRDSSEYLHIATNSQGHTQTSSVSNGRASFSVYTFFPEDMQDRCWLKVDIFKLLEIFDNAISSGAVYEVTFLSKENIQNKIEEIEKNSNDPHEKHVADLFKGAILPTLSSDYPPSNIKVEVDQLCLINLSYGKREWNDNISGAAFKKNNKFEKDKEARIEMLFDKVVSVDSPAASSVFLKYCIEYLKIKCDPKKIRACCEVICAEVNCQ